MLDQIAWFLKHQPREVDDYVFINEDQRREVTSWIENKNIPGNLILFGPAGIGKTSLAELLINKLITKQNSNLKVIKSRSVNEIDSLYTWIQKKTSAPDIKKIVYIEEFDRLSNTAMDQLKDTLLEKFQEEVIFIVCTNNINKIPYPILTRFTFKYELRSTNKEDIFSRLKNILNTEDIKFNETELNKWVNDNYKSGLRNLINSLQINSTINNTLNLQNIINKEDDLETRLVELYLNIIKITLNLSVSEKKNILFQPMNSKIGKDYAELIEIVQYNYNINWEEVYIDIFKKIDFLPIIKVLEKYINSLETKKLQHIHFIAFIGESIEILTKM
jgi:replication-associated recombination protein RarA